MEHIVKLGERGTSISGRNDTGPFSFLDVGRPNRTEARLTRLVGVERALATLPTCRLSVPPVSLVSITGWDNAIVESSIWGEGEATDLTTSLDHETCIVERAAAQAHQMQLMYFEVHAPRHAPVELRSTHAAVEVRNMRGAVTINTARGRVVVIDTSGAVTITGGVGSHVAWRGVGGPIHVHADLGAHLFLTDVAPDFELRASSVGDLSLQVPAEFPHDIVVSVPQERLICSESLKTRVRLVAPDAPERAALVTLSSSSGRVHVLSDVK